MQCHECCRACTGAPDGDADGHRGLWVHHNCHRHLPAALHPRAGCFPRSASHCHCRARCSKLCASCACVSCPAGADCMRPCTSVCGSGACALQVSCLQTSTCASQPPQSLRDAWNVCRGSDCAAEGAGFCLWARRSSAVQHGDGQAVRAAGGRCGVLLAWAAQLGSGRSSSSRDTCI